MAAEVSTTMARSSPAVGTRGLGPPRSRRLPHGDRHQHVLRLRARSSQRLRALRRGERLRVDRVGRLVAAPQGQALVEELHREVGAGHEVVVADHQHVALAHAGHAGAHVLGAGLGEVDGGVQLLDAGQALLGALGGHRVHVEPPIVLRARAAQPLRVGHHHAPRLAGADGVEPGPVHPGRVPLEQRRVLGRALVDVGLVLRGGGRLLLDVAPHHRAVAVDAEAVQHRALRRAEAVDPLHHLRAGVEEHLVHLGHGEVAVDAHPHVEPLDGQGEARRPLLSRAPRAHRAHAVGRRLGGAIGGGEPARPVVPREHRGDGRARVLPGARQRQPLPGQRCPRQGSFGAHLAGEHVHLGPGLAHVDAGAHVRQVQRPARREDVGGQPRRRVEEHPPRADLDCRREQRQLRRPAHEQRRAPVPPQPRQPLGRDAHRLAVDEALARVRRPLPLLGRAHGHPAPDGAQLGPGLRPRQERARAGAVAREEGGRTVAQSAIRASAMEARRDDMDRTSAGGGSRRRRRAKDLPPTPRRHSIRTAGRPGGFHPGGCVPPVCDRLRSRPRRFRRLRARPGARPRRVPAPVPPGRPGRAPPARRLWCPHGQRALPAGSPGRGPAMSAAGTPPRALAWAPLLAVAVLSSGLAAGVWKQMGLDMPRFCVLFVIGKIAVGAGSWLSRAPWRPGPPRAPASRAFLAFAALAAALNGLAWVAYLIAFERGPLPIVQTLSASYTAVAAVLAVIFLRERLAFVQVAGVVLVVVAGMLLAYVAEAPAPGSRGGWLVACLAAVALWGASAAVAKHAYSLAGADHPRFFLVHGLGLAATLLPTGCGSRRAPRSRRKRRSRRPRAADAPRRAAVSGRRSRHLHRHGAGPRVHRQPHLRALPDPLHRLRRAGARRSPGPARVVGHRHGLGGDAPRAPRCGEPDSPAAFAVPTSRVMGDLLLPHVDAAPSRP